MIEEGAPKYLINFNCLQFNYYDEFGKFLTKHFLTAPSILLEGLELQISSVDVGS